MGVDYSGRIVMQQVHRHAALAAQAHAPCVAALCAPLVSLRYVDRHLCSLRVCRFTRWSIIYSCSFDYTYESARDPYVPNIKA